MSRTDLVIPALGSKFVDIRDSIPGDSFEWSWIRPLPVVKYLAIHHSASPDSQTPSEIANYHISNNSWGGIGYHFVIAQDGLVYYVGDISTARANVANLNDQVIGICLIGNFIEGKMPKDEQLDSVHKLCEFLINSFPSLSTLNAWDSVVGHKDLPGQTTSCPGDSWQSWKGKIISGIKPIVETNLSGTMMFNPPKEIFLQEQVSELQETIGHQKSQIDSLQESVATLKSELVSLKEKDAMPLSLFSDAMPLPLQAPDKKDPTLTIPQAAFNLYKYLFVEGTK